jgi:hypothetical protein
LNPLITPEQPLNRLLSVHQRQPPKASDAVLRKACEVLAAGTESASQRNIRSRKAEEDGYRDRLSHYRMVKLMLSECPDRKNKKPKPD